MRVLRIYHSAVVTAWRERDRQLRREGIQVDLVSAARWNEGGSVVEFEPRGDDFAVPARTVGRHPFLFLYDPRPIWRALGRRDLDLIDIHEEAASLAHLEVRLLRRLRRHSRTPMVCYGAQNLFKQYPVPFRWFERSALRHSAGSYVCNGDAGKHYRAKGLHGPITTIGLGVDLDRFSPTRDSRRAGPFRVGYVGRLEEQKGVQVVIEALRGSGHEFYVYGDGTQRGPLEALATGFDGVDVEFHGFVTNDELPAVYRGIDVIVVPSQIRPGLLEQFGRVAVEAMASGIPVIVSNCGALPEVVSDAGVVVDPCDDPAAWRSAIDSVLAEPGKAGTMAVAGRRRAADFSWASIAHQQAEFYRSVVAGVEN